MQVSGHRLQQRLREVKAELEVLNNNATDCLKKYLGEVKDNPVTVTDRIMVCELLLVRLQCAQDLYNQRVTADCPGFGKVDLGYAVKAVGPMGRLEKFWRNVAAGEKQDRYDHRNERSKDSEYASPTITKEKALEQHRSYSKKASELRSAIATMNTIPVEVGDIRLTDADLG